MNSDGATRTLAVHAASLQYRDIPDALVRLTKNCVLDTLGVIIGASGAVAEAKIVSSYIGELGGKPESTVLGVRGKAPAQWAVFVNGGIAHMLDYDDVIDDCYGGAHVSIATIPAAFALAEKRGGANGQDLITAIAAGTDVMTRITLGTGIPYWGMKAGWFATQLLGFLGSAATAGRLLGLDADAMENAYGIAYNQMSGSRQMAVESATDLRGMQAGFAGQGGVLAAELAQRGIIGSKNALEGRYGLFKNYVRSDTPDWETIIGGLGVHFPLLDAHQFKLWPACAFTIPVITALLQLRSESRLRPDEVETISVIGGNDGTARLCEPIDLKRRPSTAIDGKYSIPFTAAVAMVKGNVRLGDYADAALLDPAVLAMADRVSYRTDGGASNSAAVSIVRNPLIEVRARNGQVFRCEPDGSPGDAQHPLSAEELETKFRDCVSLSEKPISARNVDTAIEMIRELENLADATEIIRVLSS